MSSRSRKSPKVERSTYHHENLTPVLLKAAEALLEKHGLPALSLREVARRAGVSHNAPYRHFRDRDALLAALADHGFSKLRRNMADAAQAPSAPHARRAAIGRAYVLFALSHPGMFRLMFSGFLDRADHADLARSSRSAFEVLTASFASAEEASSRAFRAWALVHGFAHLLLDRQMIPPPGITLESFIERILQSGQEPSAKEP